MRKSSLGDPLLFHDDGVAPGGDHPDDMPGVLDPCPVGRNQREPPFVVGRARDDGLAAEPRRALAAAAEAPSAREPEAAVVADERPLRDVGARRVCAGVGEEGVGERARPRRHEGDEVACGLRHDPAERWLVSRHLDAVQEPLGRRASGAASLHRQHLAVQAGVAGARRQVCRDAATGVELRPAGARLLRQRNGYLSEIRGDGQAVLQSLETRRSAAGAGRKRLSRRGYVPFVAWATLVPHG